MQTHKNHSPPKTTLSRKCTLVLRRAFLCALLGWIFLSSLALRSEQDLKEYEVKAAYLVNFGKFVEWPDESFAKGIFSICIFGKDPFGQALDDGLAGKTLKEKPVQIRRIATPEEIDHCQILFLSSSEKKQASQILGRIKNFPTLTVGEHSGFNDEGGIIQFLIQEEKIRFSINATAGESAKLKISSQLLKLAVSN